MTGNWESVDELASRLGVDASKIYGLALTGRIKSQRRGEKLFVRCEGELPFDSGRRARRVFDRIATKYYNHPVFVVSAGLASIVGLVVGIISLLPLLRPSRTQPSRGSAGTPYVAQGNFGETIPDGTWLILEKDFVGYQDGGNQFSFGCPGGTFFAVPRSQLGSNQFVQNSESDPDESEVLKHTGAGWLGPLIVQLGLDTNLPSQDYIRITAVDILTTEHRRDAEDPALIVESNPCADADSGEARSIFLVVLPKQPAALSLVNAQWERDPKPVVVRQDQPTSVRLEITARETGWYQFTIRVKYSYRGSTFQVSLRKPIRVFFPTGAAYDWYMTADGRAIRKVPEHRLKTILRELDRGSPNGFPPKLASETTRSGPIAQDERKR